MLATEKVAVKDKEVVIWTDPDLFARLLVIQEKREVSMKDFWRYSLSPVAWSLATPIGNVYKSTKSVLLTCLEKKIIWSIKYQLMQQECMTSFVSSANYQQVSILSEIYQIMS